MLADRRVTLLVTTVAVVLVSWLMAQRAILQPHQRAMREAQHRLHEEQAFLRTQQAIVNAWPQLQRHQLRLPKAPAADGLMRAVAKLAEQAQISLTSLEPQSSRAVEGATRIGVTIKFDGTYHQVGRLVSLIESATQYIRVEELDLRPATRTTSDGPETPDAQQLVASVRMVVSTLYLPPLVQAQARSAADEPL